MAYGGPVVEEASGDKKDTATVPRLTAPLRAGTAIVKLQHVLLSPLVILATPSEALFNQNLIVTVLVTAAGLTGMLLARKSLAAMASIALLALLLWGKAASTILRTSSPDTAILVVEFTTIIVLLEASSVVIAFNKNISRLKPDQDELLQTWLWNQLKNQGKLGLVALGLSIVLLPVAGLTSIPSNQLILSATLALLAVVVLLFLITHRREPAGEE